MWMGSALAVWAAVASAEPAALDDLPLRNALTAGGGALWFVDAQLAPVGRATPTWSVRYLWEPVAHVGLELAWTGNAELEPQDGHLRLASIVEPSLRLNLLPGGFVPFVAAGFGHGAFLGRAGTTDADVLTLPLAAGLDLRPDDLVVSARATWRRGWFDESADFSELGADHVTATVELGQRF